jgi:hypothetical protein
MVNVSMKQYSDDAKMKGATEESSDVGVTANVFSFPRKQRDTFETVQVRNRLEFGPSTSMFSFDRRRSV